MFEIHYSYEWAQERPGATPNWVAVGGHFSTYKDVKDAILDSIDRDIEAGCSKTLYRVVEHSIKPLPEIFESQ